MSTPSPIPLPSHESDLRSSLRRKRGWMILAFLGSILGHVALWSWFQQIYFSQRAFPSKEKLQLRKFHMERVEIPASWLAPQLPPPTKTANKPGSDRASLPPPTSDLPSFSKILGQTPSSESSPNLPSGTPPIPLDKPKLSLNDHVSVPAEILSRRQLDQNTSSLREQESPPTHLSAPAGRPALSSTGNPVLPSKNEIKELDVPSDSPTGSGRGGSSSVKYGGSSRIEDFFGPVGGLPPVSTIQEPAIKPKFKDHPELLPKGLLGDLPQNASKFESLNSFLNVELFTQTRQKRGATEGYFLIRITAKPGATLKVLGRDIFYVVDVSSSIGPSRLRSFKEGLRRGLTELNPSDRIKLLAFRDKLTPFREDWIQAENLPLGEIQTWIQQLHSSGVTDFYESLRPLAKTKTEKGRMLMAQILSDGIPTQGILDSTRIISELSESNENNLSIFTLSAGDDVNDFLLDLLSYRNQGWLRYARKISDSPDLFQKLAQQIRNPVLQNLRFRFAGVDDSQVFPQNLPHLYLDSPLLMFGRYTPGQTTNLSLQILGESVEGTRELLVKLPIANQPTGPYTIASSWARQKIYHLLSRMTRLGGDSSAVLDEIRNLAQEYRVDLPYF